MQARVEPAFLFNTLARVRTLYESHVEPAERMLDDLIRYLRAAMPHMRSTSSTVGQETELARAYLDIVKLGVRGQLATEIRVSAGVASCRLPPMMLLPMVDRALARNPDSPATAINLRIDCDSPAVELLRIHVACEAPGLLHQTEDASLADLRDRLAALYGDRYRLVVSGGASLASHMTLEIPLEPVASLADLPAGAPRLDSAA
jgi:LytS/YehU family sensor histidine kinase